jgi:hypothetical protein
LDLIDLFLILYKNKEMELNKISEGLFELVDSATGTVITRGSWDHCFDWMAELDREHENASYAAFLSVSGI